MPRCHGETEKRSGRFTNRAVGLGIPSGFSTCVSSYGHSMQHAPLEPGEKDVHHQMPELLQLQATSLTWWSMQRPLPPHNLPSAC